MFYLITILFGVVWILTSIVRNYASTKSPISHKYLNHGKNVPIHNNSNYRKKKPLRRRELCYCSEYQVFDKVFGIVAPWRFPFWFLNVLLITSGVEKPLLPWLMLTSCHLHRRLGGALSKLCYLWGGQRLVFKIFLRTECRSGATYYLVPLPLVELA